MVTPVDDRHMAGAASICFDVANIGVVLSCFGSLGFPDAPCLKESASINRKVRTPRYPNPRTIAELAYKPSAGMAAKALSISENICASAGPGSHRAIEFV